MAAPSGTTWGSISGSGTKQGRLGLHISVSNTNTQSTVTIDVWFWSRVSVDDSSNDFYFDNGKSSATTNRGSVDVKTTSNSSWSTSNQVKIKTYSYSYARGTSASTKTCAAKLTGIEWATGTMTVSKSYTIPALTSYKITFNANGGTGAPGSQTKYYGKTLKLSSTKPTRTGYTFQGWGTSATGSVVYAAGANYTANASDTLYAIWKANTWTVSYDANGGSGAPGAQTKTYGVNLTLSSTKPTRSGYNFLGWGTSSGSTTVSYAAGASYTDNAAITLYAIWQVAYVPPRLTNLTVDRCTSAGVINDDGTYLKITFDWESDKTITAASSYIQWLAPDKAGSVNRYTFTTSNLSGTGGSVSVVVGSNWIDTEYAWSIVIHLQDASGSNDFEASVGTSMYIMDVREGGKGVSFGEAASSDGFHVNFPAIFRKGMDIIGALTGDAATFSGAFNNTWVKTLSNGRPAFKNHVGLNNGMYLQGGLAGNASYTNMLGMNASNQVELNWTTGGLKGRVFKKLWSGTWSKGGTITISDLPYYRMLLCDRSGGVTMIPLYKDIEGTSGAASWRGFNAYTYLSNGGDDAFEMSGISAVEKSSTTLNLVKAHRFSIYYHATPTAANNVEFSIKNIWGIL